MTGDVSNQAKSRKTRAKEPIKAASIDHSDAPSSNQKREDQTMSTDHSSEAPLPSESHDEVPSEPVAPPMIEISRHAEANRIISKYVGWGAGSGVVPAPFLDVAAVATVQVMMVRELLALYEVPFSETRVRTTVSVLIGSLSPSVLAGATAMTFLKVVPFVGFPLAMLTMPLLASAATYAVGKVVSAHLEEGGNLDTLDSKSVKTRVRDAFKEGKAKLKKASDRVLA
jgi:uncharacterized protein (DUF697 family)